MTLDARSLALYAFLTEIGACERRIEVFDLKAQIKRSDLDYILCQVLQPEVVALILNMREFLDCQARRYFDETWLIEAGWLYSRTKWADNTFGKRYVNLLFGRHGVWEPAPQDETVIPW
jgi:hypothetical protein